jgi:Ca-activated chloride channel family protein
MIQNCLVMIFILSFSNSSLAQSEERKLIRDGNKLYLDKKFSDAEVKYKKSLGVNNNSVPGNYNLGNAYYKQGKFDEASQQYQSVFSNKDISDVQKAKAFHNLGNSMLEAKKYPESIEAFKNSLKLNPKDNDTRYNLAYAQSMLQQQQQQQKKDNKDNKDKNQQNKDQQNKDQKNQDKKDQDKDQQSKDQQGKEKDQQKQAGQKKQDISKEDAEKILQALNNDEKNTQKKLIKKESTKIQIEKAW